MRLKKLIQLYGQLTVDPWFELLPDKEQLDILTTHDYFPERITYELFR